jgi:hypothetical protein
MQYMMLIYETPGDLSTRSNEPNEAFRGPMACVSQSAD